MLASISETVYSSRKHKDQYDSSQSKIAMRLSVTNLMASERSTPAGSNKSMFQHNSKYNSQHNTGLQLNWTRIEPKTSYITHKRI